MRENVYEAPIVTTVDGNINGRGLETAAYSLEVWVETYVILAAVVALLAVVSQIDITP